MLIFLLLVAIGIIELPLLLICYQLATVRQNTNSASLENRRHTPLNEKQVVATCLSSGVESDS